MAKAKPNTPQPAAVAPAPEQTQEHAGAGQTQTEPVQSEPVILALLVQAKVEGFRRAGRAWTKAQTRVEAADLTDVQIAQIFSEPMLDVVGVGE